MSARSSVFAPTFADLVRAPRNVPFPPLFGPRNGTTVRGVYGGRLGELAGRAPDAVPPVHRDHHDHVIGGVAA